MRAAISGAATGIGAHVVHLLKSNGYHVTAFDIAEPTDVDRWIKVDLSDHASITQAASQAEGPFDCLINNAGLPPREGTAQKVLAVNFTGLVLFNQAMEAKLADGASIVNTASRAGAQWRDNLDQIKTLLAIEDINALAPFIAAQEIDHIRAYTLSKEALIVWTMLQAERLLARDLRMNSVSPAAVSTGILQDFATAFGERMAKNVARVGRPGLPEEVAQVICFLASPQSHWIKGQDIVIDGGMSANAMKDALNL
jgi:NAD(P)-dependent dehydrogenase (short-subunit alcohol dehydrogenase family)